MTEKKFKSHKKVTVKSQNVTEKKFKSHKKVTVKSQKFAVKSQKFVVKSQKFAVKIKKSSFISLIDELNSIVIEDCCTIIVKRLKLKYC